MSVLYRLQDRIDAQGVRAGSALVDACRRLDLAALPEALEALDRAVGGPEGGPVALVCRQSVVGALAVLHLLDRGVDFVLVPAELKDLQATLDGLRFCARRVEVLESAAPEGEGWWRRPEGLLRAGPAPGEAAPLPEGPPRMFLMTSGSMGGAKLVAHCQDRFLDNAGAAARRFGLGPPDRVALPVPLAHMYGLGAALVPGVLAGASLDIQAGANLLRVMDRERRFDPTVAFFSPQLCDMMAQRRRSPRPHRLVVTAGAPISEERFRAFDARFGPLVNLYGSTEMGAVAACAPGDPVDRRASGLGPPMQGMTLRLGEGGDADEGELLVHARNGFLAYVDGEGRSLGEAPEWFSTRDLARRRPDGALELLGRVDDAVNRDGRLLRFAEVEARLLALPGVARVAVLRSGVQTPRGDGMVAFCEPVPGAHLDPAALRAACAALLPTFAIPDALHVLPALPALPSGKVDRAGLTARLPPEGT